MSQVHVRLLRLKRRELSNFIDPSIELLNELVSVNAISETDKDAVSGRRSYDEKSLQLVNILLCKPDSSFQKFIEALNSTEQQHVVHILTGQGESPLSRVRRLVLWKASRDRLISRVDAVQSPLLANLVFNEVITDVDKQRVEAYNVNEDRIGALIDVIARKSHAKHGLFIKAVKDSGYGQFAEALEGLELGGQVDVGLLPSKKRRILRDKMKALVSGSQDGVDALNNLMEQNGFAVSGVSEESINISFRCFTENSLQRLELFTQLFCRQFLSSGKFEFPTLHIADEEFKKISKKLNKLAKAGITESDFSVQPIDVLEQILIKTLLIHFIDVFRSVYQTQEVIRAAFKQLAAVCYNWWQTMNGWAESSAGHRHWFKHKLRQALNCRLEILLPYKAYPRHKCRQQMGRVVYGLAYLDSRLYVIYSQSDTIRVFGANSAELPSIRVNGLTSPSDIVSCCEARQLYIADSEGALVWRVSLDGQVVKRWMPSYPKPALKFIPLTLSVTFGRLLVTSANSSELLLYNADGVKLKCVSLPDMKELRHAMETSHGTFIVSHNSPQPAVREVDSHGSSIHVYSNGQHLTAPSYLLFDSDGRIFVADWSKHQVLLLNSRLQMERILLDVDHNSLGLGPLRLCYVEQSGRLLIGCGLWENFDCLQEFIVR